MNWFQRNFIENESMQAEMKIVAEEAAQAAGYDIVVLSTGQIMYKNNYTYENQADVLEAIRAEVEFIF